MLKQLLYSYIKPISTGLTVLLIAWIVSQVSSSLSVQFYDLLPRKIWALLFLTTLGICLILTTLFLLTKNNKINIDDYERPKELYGVSKCKKTGKLYCTSCLAKNIKVPVIDFDLQNRCSLKECDKVYWTQKYIDLQKE